MKDYSLLLTIASLVTLSSCVSPTTSTGGSMSNSQESSSITNSESVSESVSIDENADYIVSEIKTLENGKTYLEVDGNPFALRGGQLRVDGLLNRDYEWYPNAMDPLSYDQIEEYFKQAKEFNLNTLELALDWKRIEIEKDVYDFTLVDKLLSMSNKYDLKCEFLWFSTNMCGDSHQFHIPDYIIYDQETYPRFEVEKESHSGLYGNVFWLILNDEDLMARERLVLEKLMDHVYEWNLENGKKNPLIGMQIHNESDGLLRWRLDQRNISLNGEKVTPEFLWNVTLEALDNAGKTVKDAKYKIYTRCNMTVTFGVGEFPQFAGKGFSPLDVLRLEGIDMIGDDPYSSDPKKINKTVKEYAVEGNYPHISENMGNYASSPALFLTAYQAGGSYMFYDFATPQYFIFVNGSGSYQMDQGIINPDFTYKAHSAEARSIVNGIAKMGSVLPLVNSEDFAAFNVLTEENKKELTQTICTSSIQIKYETKNGGVAYAIEHGEYLYLYSTQDCNMTIENASFTYKADIGHFEVDEFIVEDSEIVNPTISVGKEKLYRIKIRSINKEVSSTTNENV